ncbi:lipopolysaccharide biosynthesis protein [Sphingomonas sp. 2R-10]|uniref:lipopolysaccharide biosynthesis protein n=1 Tax=Sphingomonas sp. 2R-10 TaxID=3045148 RepID=UPI000F7B832F|nr:lipopolysaccharide biosynthesis protein [Sphingomonas sp. 2R-10]MDJ0278404.1 lipopolysaccharide biosynthesis protein [Sphingomonas sp. 2R-10]
MEPSAESTAPPAESLQNQVRRAVIWRSGSQIVGQIVSWASTFLVIRLLTPGDYGLVAMTGVVLLLLNMLNGHGLANALIQHGEVTRHQQRQVFGMLLMLNLLLGGLQFLLAPLAAAYYREPFVADLLRVQALLYVTTPFSSFAYALLARRMDFHRQAQVNLLSSLLAALAAIGGAYAGLGVWTLVLAPAVMFATRAIGMMTAARAWMWPSFDFRGAGHLARYGGVVAGASLLGFAQSQADILVAGRAFDAHAVGVYTTALFLTQIFTNKVVPPINEVAFSAYAKMRDDPAAVAQGFVRSVRVLMLIAVPFFVGLAVTAGPAVAIALGPKWSEAAPLVVLLGLAMPFMTLQALFPPAVDALGRPGTTAGTTAIGAVILPIAFLIGARFGIEGVAGAWIVAHPLLLAIVAARALPVIGLSAGAFLRAVAPAFGAGAAMAGAVTLAARVAAPLSPAPMLALSAAVGGMVYAGSLWLFARSAVLDAWAMLRKS